MPAVAASYTAETFLGTGLLAMARVVGANGVAVTQSSILSIACTVYDRDNYNAVVATPAVSVTASVFNTLQTGDPRWTADAIGYNFLFDFGPANFPLARSYSAVFTFTPTFGDPFDFVVKVFVRDPAGL